MIHKKDQQRLVKNSSLLIFSDIPSDYLAPLVLIVIPTPTMAFVTIMQSGYIWDFVSVVQRVGI